MSQFARPSSDIENPGGWTAEPLWEKIDEEPYDDVDYLISPKSATGDSFTVGLSGVTDPEVHTGHVVRIRAKTAVSGTFKFELMQGAVVIKDSGDVVLTTVFAEYNMTLSEAEAANITDYPALRVRVTAVITQKNQRQNVSWIRVEVPDVTGEEHSGSGSISGNGSSAGTAEKGGRGSAFKSAGGMLLAIGLAGMLGIASVFGGGSQLAVGKKNASASASVSGSGSVIAIGQATEAEEHSGITAITGNGILAGIGIKQALGDLIITGGGSIVATGPVVESHFGVVVITGNGTLIGLGAKSAEGIGAVSGGGVITVGKEAPSVVATGSQVSREERGLLFIGNPDDIIFIGKKKPVFISED